MKHLSIIQKGAEQIYLIVTLNFFLEIAFQSQLESPILSVCSDYLCFFLPLAELTWVERSSASSPGLSVEQ